MILTTLTTFIVHVLNFWHNNGSTTTAEATAHGSSLSFELRHQHAVSSTAHVIFADIPATHIYSHRDGRAPYRIRTRHITTHRPPSFDAYSQARIRSIRYAQSQDLQWEEDGIIGPDVESRESLLELAKMTNNAYVEPDDPGWYDLEGNWSEVRYLFEFYLNIQLGICFILGYLFYSM